MTHLDNIFKGKLSGPDFPSTRASDLKDRPQNVIVFIIGGVTYEEAKEIALTYN